MRVIAGEARSLPLKCPDGMDHKAYHGQNKGNII